MNMGEYQMIFRKDWRWAKGVWPDHIMSVFKYWIIGPLEIRKFL